MAETIEPTRLRQGLYRYFGGALSPPVPGQLAAIAAAGGYLDAAGIELFPYYGPWRAFHGNVSSAEVGRLETEYVSLFASGVDGALCPPTESYYVGDAEGGKIARVVAQVEREYGDMSLAVTYGSEAPDHAATELEAMSMLCAREADAREAGSLADTLEALALEDRFLRGHLAVWFPEFRARLDEIPSVSDFYATLIDAVYAFVVHEVDFVTRLRSRIEGAAA